MKHDFLVYLKEKMESCINRRIFENKYFDFDFKISIVKVRKLPFFFKKKKITIEYGNGLWLKFC